MLTAREDAMRQSFTTSSDGVEIALYEGGNPEGLEILFIHGFSQCAFCWQGQFESEALKGSFRLAALDIRGHGASGMPSGREYYQDDKRFADDIKAAMQALGLKRPVLVAWSYAGRLITDYVRTFGTGDIAGINYVCARTNNDPEFSGPGTAFISAMLRDDPAKNIAATRAFVKACFAIELAAEQFEKVFDYNMIVSPEIRGHHIRRPPSDGMILATIDIPVLVTQGSEDLLVSKGLAEWTAKTIPGAVLSLYEGIGHTPFVEDAPRFDAELAEFVTRAAAQR
ncbi:MAG: ydjP [Rhizobium sp.]|nr:ydjP [Rhizobium sp.]